MSDTGKRLPGEYGSSHQVSQLFSQGSAAAAVGLLAFLSSSTNHSELFWCHDQAQLLLYIFFLRYSCTYKILNKKMRTAWYQFPEPHPHGLKIRGLFSLCWRTFYSRLRLDSFSLPVLVITPPLFKNPSLFLKTTKGKVSHSSFPWLLSP